MSNPLTKTDHALSRLILALRRFKVSGGIVLNTLADKILMPLMGWVRNYHGYVFCDRRDGACFGAKDSNAIDLMHVNFSYFYLMDDKKVRQLC